VGWGDVVCCPGGIIYTFKPSGVQSMVICQRGAENSYVNWGQRIVICQLGGRE